MGFFKEKAPSVLFEHTWHLTMMFFYYKLKSSMQILIERKVGGGGKEGKETHYIHQAIYQQSKSLLICGTISIINVYAV